MDYESNNLDLSDPKIYRDLTKYIIVKFHWISQDLLEPWILQDLDDFKNEQKLLKILQFLNFCMEVTTQVSVCFIIRIGYLCTL